MRRHIDRSTRRPTAQVRREIARIDLVLGLAEAVRQPTTRR